MKDVLVWVVLAVVLGGVANGLLRAMESRRWISDRTRGLSRGGAAYHMRELQSIYDPGIQHVIEIQTPEIKRRNEFGDPFG